MFRRFTLTCSIGLLAVTTLAACDRAPSASAEAALANNAASNAPVTANVTEADEAEAERQARAARAAADPVAGIVDRAEICLHFAGEEPFDDARRAQIDQAFEENRCETVVADGDALKAQRPQDAARIDQALANLRP